jgi:HSP20 family protein
MLTRYRLAPTPSVRTFSPVRSLDEFARDVDRVFTALSAQPTRAAAAPALPVTLWHDEGNIYVEADVPGVADDQLELLAEGEQLTIRGTRAIDLPEGAEVLRAERAATQFERTLALPGEIDPDAVTASLDRGVLRITLPRAQSSRPRRIAVNGTIPAATTGRASADADAHA